MAFKHRHTFKYEIYDSDDELFPNRTVTVEISGDAHLNGMLEAFREYLDGSGFYVEGELEINNSSQSPLPSSVNQPGPTLYSLNPSFESPRHIENQKMFKSMMVLKK